MNDVAKEDATPASAPTPINPDQDHDAVLLAKLLAAEERHGERLDELSGKIDVLRQAANDRDELVAKLRAKLKDARAEVKAIRKQADETSTVVLGIVAQLAAAGD